MELKTFNSIKYNNGVHINLDDIPIADLEIALHDFSEDSNGLEKSLRALWMNGIKTYSCRSGRNDPFAIGHITFEEGEDAFSYFSEALVRDPRVRISVLNERQMIEFAGRNSEKEWALLFIARDILTGKKKNKEAIEEELNKPYPKGEWVRVLKSHEGNAKSTYWGPKVYIEEK